ncbi:MAG: GDSL-type esterase/lipase family protein [Candidatus Auribacterota bacterium]|nr:GDSL-type esterase/lipase family protein [Candidatus Auribacterota bacterium]
MKINTKLRILKISMVLLMAALLLLLIELFSRRLIPPPDNFYIWPPGIERTYRPNQEILPGTSPRVWFRTNSYGLRSYNPIPTDDYRILVLGGSAAECLYLNQRETWPRRIISRLQEASPRLRIWVGNGGRSNQNSRDHILHLEKLPLKALDVDAIIILTGVNDLLLRLRQGEGYNPDYLQQPEAYNHQLDHAFLFVPYQYSLPAPPFYKKLGVWRVAKRIYRRFFGERPQDPEGKIIVKWRENRRQSDIRLDTLPKMVSALDEYKNNIEELITIAAKKGIRLIFVTQPALWKEDILPEEKDRLWMGGVGQFKTQPGQPYYTPGVLAKGLETYNALLSGYCRWKGVEYLDLASRFPRNTDLFYDDCHFTIKGSEHIARVISDYLFSRPPWGTK